MANRTKKRTVNHSALPLQISENTKNLNHTYYLMNLLPKQPLPPPRIITNSFKSAYQIIRKLSKYLPAQYLPGASA